MRALTAFGAGYRVTGLRRWCSIVHLHRPVLVAYTGRGRNKAHQMPYVRVKAMAGGGTSSALNQTALVDYRQRLQYQARLTASEGRLSAEQELKDKDSVFRELHGTTVHYKLAQAIKQEQPTAMHCYHGFGANTFSWSYVYKSLSEQLHAQVTKHDMPGFGLTLRPKDLSGYTLDYNGRLGRYVMDAELAAAGLLNPADIKSGLGPPANLDDLQSVSEDCQSGQRESELAPNTTVLQAVAAKHGPVRKSSKQQPASPTSSLDFPSSGPDADSNSAATSHIPDGKKIRRVLVGHSVGAACAAAEYINNPEDIDGLVLVAPAITAFSSDLKAQANNTERTSDSVKQQPQGNRGIRVVTAMAKALASRITGVMLWLIQPVLVLFLRTLVRSRNFWKKGLSNAWHSRDGVSDELLDAYRLPQLVRGWEIGLVRFVRARVADDRSLAKVWREAYEGKVRKSQALQLADAVQQNKIPVLIVHGSRDRLVPLSNSRRLAALVPNTQLVELQDCGHTPQEELPAQFIEAVKTYMASLQ